MKSQKVALLAFLALTVGVSVWTEESAPVSVEKEMEAAAESSTAGARFTVGLTYASGLTDVSDFIIDAFEDLGYDCDDSQIPIGLVLSGGYRFDFGGEIMLDAGPFTMVYVDAVGGIQEGTYTYWDVPVGLTLGYAFLSNKSISPYLRGGIRHHLAGGDFYDSSTPGPFVAGGVNFLNTSAIGVQLEVAYDASEVTLENEFTGQTEDVEPGGVLVSIRATF